MDKAYELFKELWQHGKFRIVVWILGLIPIVLVTLAFTWTTPNDRIKQNTQDIAAIKLQLATDREAQKEKDFETSEFMKTQFRFDCNTNRVGAVASGINCHLLMGD